MNKVDCIIPAAGLSSRMGEWKLMLPFRNGFIIDACLQNALSFCSRIILVGGYRHQELFEHCPEQSNILKLYNPDYQQGMFSSILTGINSVETEYFFIVHADMPCITTNIFRILWKQQLENGTVFPGSVEHSGHPVLISTALRRCIQENLALSSIKKMLIQHPVRYLNLSYQEIHFDIDTPTAYSQLLSR